MICGNAALIIHFFGPYGMHSALTHVFLIIVHCNMINASIILDVLRRSPTYFSCHFNALYLWEITFETTSLYYKTKTALTVYY